MAEPCRPSPRREGRTGRVAAIIAVTLTLLAVGGCTSTPPSNPVPIGTVDVGVDASYDTSRIAETGTSHLSIGETDYIATSYENAAYRCGRTGVFPFVVLEQASALGEQRPLWVMLHGGGVGYYDGSGQYVGSEGHNDAETTDGLIGMARRFIGADGSSDTFVADRIRSGDRVVLGSLCDHDLMMGLGQPYPNDPYHADTVDGLLANLAMLEAVRDGTAAVQRRPTSSTWILGTSAGSYGAYVLAHNLWTRGRPPAGVVMDSGLLSSRSSALFAVVPQAGYDVDALALKLGPYFIDTRLWAENAVGAGFDVPLFDVVENGDGGCGGRVPPVPAAQSAGYPSNCDWLHGALGEAIVAHGDPSTQQVHSYPGTTHTASDISGHPMQADLRTWYALLART